MNFDNIVVVVVLHYDVHVQINNMDEKNRNSGTETNDTEESPQKSSRSE